MQTADQVKARVLQHFRYDRQFPMVALEANCTLRGWSDSGQADILGVDKKGLLHEVEVKLSIADLRVDIKKAKHWHHYRTYFGEEMAATIKPKGPEWKTAQRRLETYELYREISPEAAERQLRRYPTAFFYFAVPYDLVGTKEAIENLYPYAGIYIVYNGHVQVGKSPFALSREKVSGYFLMRMAKEMSATLTRLALKIAENGNGKQ